MTMQNVMPADCSAGEKPLINTKHTKKKESNSKLHTFPYYCMADNKTSVLNTGYVERNL